MLLSLAFHNNRTASQCMEMCPSPGLNVNRLGDRADPLPPKRKKRYEQHKARIQAGKAAAILSQKGQAEGGRKTAAKKVHFIIVSPVIRSTKLSVAIAPTSRKYGATSRGTTAAPQHLPYSPSSTTSAALSRTEHGI